MAIAAKPVTSHIEIDHTFPPDTDLAAVTAAIKPAVTAALEAVAEAYTTAAVSPDGVDVIAEVVGGCVSVPDPPA